MISRSFSSRMAGTFRIWTNAFAAMVLSSSAAWATPTLSGDYQGALGKVSVTDTHGHIAGRLSERGQCAFPKNQTVLRGEFEGNVLVGEVSLCQVGPGCSEQATVPFLGFVEDGMFYANIELARGCTSAALDGRRLVFRNVGGGGEASAERIARSGLDPKTEALRARKAFEKAEKLLLKGDFLGAVSQYKIGLSYKEDDTVALGNLGVAYVGLGHYPQAIEVYEKALRLAPDPINYFNLACAQLKAGNREKTYAALTRAVDLGLDAKSMNDPDLAALRDEAQFKELVKRAPAELSPPVSATGRVNSR
jgi:hypothetical protein